MQREVQRRSVPSGYTFQLKGPQKEIGMALNRHVGLEALAQVEILSEMLRKLRTVAEAALGEPLPERTVYLSMPWMASWQNDSIDGKILDTALRQAGIKSMRTRPTDPNYISEGGAVLAAKKRHRCQAWHCVGPEYAEEEVLMPTTIIYFVRWVVLTWEYKKKRIVTDHGRNLASPIHPSIHHFSELHVSFWSPKTIKSAL